MQSLKVLFTAAVLILGLSAFTNPINNGDDTKSVKVDVAASQIIWKGYKVTGEHAGTINVQEGSFEYNGDVLTGGEFTIDMASIACTDLTGEYAQKLVGHLKSPDFFGVETHPTAKVVLTNVVANGVNRYKVTADLTIKETTKTVKFIVTTAQEMGKNVATTDIQIDRTEYDVRYGSGSFFDNLGDKTIYDEFDLSVRLVSAK